MVRAPNQGAAPAYSRVKNRTRRPVKRAPAHITDRYRRCAILDLRLRGAGLLLGSEAGYLTPVAPAYLRRNLSTRPAVSTIFCLPV